MHHYTFYSYEQWGRGYIGSRSCRCNPEQDINYFGSYTDKAFSPTQKIILELHNTAKESLEAETALHNLFDVANNPHFANKQANRNTSVVRGKNHPNYGKKFPPHSAEHKRKISEGVKKALANLTPEAHARMVDASAKANAVRKHTDETKAKIRAARLGTKASEETRRKLSEIRKGKKRGPYKKRSLNKDKT